MRLRRPPLPDANSTLRSTSRRIYEVILSLLVATVLLPACHDEDDDAGSIGQPPGSLVPDFGIAGVVTGNPTGSSDWARGVALDTTALYVVGDDSGGSRWRIEKRRVESGALETGFDTDGIVTSDPSSNPDRAFAIAIDSSFMYVVGDDSVPGLSNAQWRIEKRNLLTGALVPGFGTGGVAASNPSSRFDIPLAIAIDASAMYVVGYDSSPGVSDSQWRIEKRSLATGELIGAFDGDGVVTTNPGPGFDDPRAVALDSTAMYVAGYDSSLGAMNRQWRVEKRDLTTGALIFAFGIMGVVTSNPSPEPDDAFAIAIDSSTMYVVGTDSSTSQWRIEKRSLHTGALVGGFGTGGVVASNPGSGPDTPWAVAIDSTFMYVVGYDSVLGSDGWRAEKRNLSNGALVPSFAAGGVLTSDPSAGSDQVTAVAIDMAHLYLIGYDSAPGNLEWRMEKRLK